MKIEGLWYADADVRAPTNDIGTDIFADADIDAEADAYAPGDPPSPDGEFAADADTYARDE